MTDIAIRPVAPGDLTAITAIYADAVANGTASYELQAPDLAETTRRCEALIDAQFPYLVAEGGGTVLGYAYAGAFRPRPAYRFVVEDSVYIAPEAKGRGLGLRLLACLIEEATQLGFRQMIAVIGDGHADSASVRLHARLGFREAGRLEGTGFKHGRWLDTAFMQLALNAGRDAPPDAASLPERLFRGQN